MIAAGEQNIRRQADLIEAVSRIADIGRDTGARDLTRTRFAVSRDIGHMRPLGPVMVPTVLERKQPRHPR